MKIPRGWIIVILNLACAVGLYLLFVGVTSVFASECKNSQVSVNNLPPKAYRHEPKMPYQVVSAELLAAMNRHDWTVGYYGKTTGVVFVCAGLTGKALRIVRMHEEAHAMGWRH